MDALVGFTGRKELFDHLDDAVHKTKAEGKSLIVALVDLDLFYRINELKGMSLGNRVLRIIETRLSETEETIGSSVCRIGDNKFLITIPLGNHANEDWLNVEILKHAVDRPIDNDGSELYLTASIGVAVFPNDGYSSEQLICHAETALYLAKQQGGNRALFYHASDSLRLNRRSNVEAALRPALHMRQFHLNYQPTYRLSDGKLRGFEVLMRWNHPELGSIIPTEFIPIAEDMGLIIPIGEWVLREACKTLADMNKYGLNNLLMSVNISPKQLQDPAFSQTMLHILDEYGLAASSIEVVIVGSGMLDSSEMYMTTLNWLRAAGVCVSLDDFGTGHSSFTNLNQLPISSLKIDKSMVKMIDRLSMECIIVESMIKLAHNLGLEVIAEGVVNEEQYNLLREWGCDYVQGFLLGKLMEPGILDLSMIRR